MPIASRYTIGGKGIHEYIDRSADANWLDDEQRSLQCLLDAACASMRCHEVSAKIASILDRLKRLADNESETFGNQYILRGY